MERALSAAALIAAAAALGIALAGGTDRAPRPGDTPVDSAELAARVSRLENELAAIRTESIPGGAAHAKTAGNPGDDPAPWPLVARRLAVELKLDLAQADAVDKALERCHGALAEAAGHEDAIWRDRLARRARRDMTEKVTSALDKEQAAHFKTWLDAPANAAHAIWFLVDKPCGGCGKPRSTEGQEDAAAERPH